MITTEGEIHVNTVKIQEAKVKGLPMLSEEVLSDAVSTGTFPDDLSDYVLAGSPPLKSRASAKASSAKASSSAKATAAKATASAKRASAKTTAAAEEPARKVRTTKKTLEEADAEVEAAEEEEEKPKRGKKATSAKATAKATAKAASSAKSTASARSEATSATSSRAKAEESEPSLKRQETNLDMTDKKSEVVFSFDTTGSMYPCLTQVRRKIQECVTRLFSEIGAENLKIGVTAHGDYCDAKYSYVTKHCPLTTDMKKIVNFVETVGATGGGDAPECYELVLHEALSFPWTPGWNHVLVVIGDELPHEANQNPGNLDWKEECRKLKDAGVQVHGVQALNRKHASKFYAQIANLTGGVHLPLDQFNSIVDLVMAVCYREARPSVLEKFEKEVQAGGRYNRSIKTMFDRMLGRALTTSEAPGDMNAVSSGRFQVLDVDHDISIKDFVHAQGVTFKTGRGFYEFTKPEVIQDYKEIILMDPTTGDMFEGDYARTLINAPKGGPKGVRISPGDIDFIPFIQSTSHNRKLIGGTRFLYEVEEM